MGKVNLDIYAYDGEAWSVPITAEIENIIKTGGLGAITEWTLLIVPNADNGRFFAIPARDIAYMETTPYTPTLSIVEND